MSVKINVTSVQPIVLLLDNCAVGKNACPISTPLLRLLGKCTTILTGQKSFTLKREY